MKLTTHNGGISLDDFQGAAEFTARNGGVTLRNVSGDIRGATRNGGLNITLEGDRWNGPGSTCKRATAASEFWWASAIQPSSKRRRSTDAFASAFRSPFRATWVVTS